VVGSAYVPPNRRNDGKSSEVGMGNARSDDLNSVRVSNIPAETRDEDLKVHTLMI
jgi:hypothetical protein